MKKEEEEGIILGTRETKSKLKIINVKRSSMSMKTNILNLGNQNAIVIDPKSEIKNK